MTKRLVVLSLPIKATGCDCAGITEVRFRISNNPIIATKLESLNDVITLPTRVGIIARRACGTITKIFFEMDSFQ